MSLRHAVLALASVLAVHAIGLTARAESGNTKKMDVRERLVVASRGSINSHRALRWIKKSASGTTELHTEFFRKGDTEGVVLMSKRGPRWIVLQSAATDGDVIVFYRGERCVGVSPGLKRMQVWVQPWQLARTTLAKRFGRLPRRELATVLSMQVDSDDAGPTLQIGLSAGLLEANAQGQAMARFEWLDSDYWERLRDVAVKNRAVFLSGPGFEGRLSLDTGLPVSFSIPQTSDGGSVRGEAVSARWRSEQWESQIARWVGQADPAGVRQLKRYPGVPAALYEQLLDDLLSYESEAMQQLPVALDAMGEGLGAYAFQCGRRGPYALREPARESERLKREAMNCGAISCERALRAGWDRRAAFMLGIMARDSCLELFDDPRFR